MKARLPRKLKKKIKKLPIGSYCYGSTIGDKGRMVNGRRRYKTVHCPFGMHQTHCGLLNTHEYLMLSDSVKICGIEELKDAMHLKESKSKKHQIWYDEEGNAVRFTKDGFEDIE